MDNLRQYALSIIVTALICGIVTGLSEKSSGNGIMRYLCGLVLAVSILMPMTRIHSVSFPEKLTAFHESGKRMAELGEKMAQESKSTIIKQEMEAYILDKASQACADASVDVALDDNQLLESVVITGSFSTYDKQQLENVLLSDLGITEEKLLWTS